MLRITCLWSILFLSLSSCEEVVDWDFQTGENDLPVVDAILTNERRIQELRLTHSFGEPNGAGRPLVADRVTVRVGEETYPFVALAEDASRYRSQVPFRAGVGEEVQLTVEWEGQRYTARSTAVPILPLGAVTFFEAGVDSLSVVAPPVYTPEEQALYIVDIDGPPLGGSEPTRARLYFYSFSTLDVSEFFRGQLENVFLPRGSTVAVSKYALTTEFAAYLRALMMEKDWRGGLYDELPSSLPTNVSNGGLGFFATAAVLRDTVEAQ